MGPNARSRRNHVYNPLGNWQAERVSLRRLKLQGHYLATGFWVAAIGLSGCGSDLPIEISETCLPDLGLIAAREADDAPIKAVDIDVFLDTSVSSVLFGRTQTQGSPYRDLVAWLRAGSSDENVNLFGFANNIAPVGPEAYLNAGLGRTGVCTACGQSLTRLDTLFDRIADSGESRLSIVVTDLWLDNNDILDQRAVSLQRPIETIMARGDAVGVIGVRSPYAHQVYDVPTLEGIKTLPANTITERPFFVLIVGEPEQVDYAYSRIASEVLGDEGEAHQWSFFAPTVFPDTIRSLDFQPFGDETPFRRPSVDVFDGTPIFEVDLAKARINNDTRELDGLPVEAGLAVELGGLPAVAESYQLIRSDRLLDMSWDAACNGEDAWMEQSFPDVARLGKGESGDARFVIDGAAGAYYDLIEGESWLVGYALEQTELAKVDEAGWMSVWSFSPEDGDELYNAPPESFPVLNLVRFSELLERSAEANFIPSPVASGTVILHTR